MLKCKQLEQDIADMKGSLETESKDISPELAKDFTSLFTGCDKNDVPPFMKLFWEEQQKYVQASHHGSVRYHPMVIKFCLSLAAKIFFFIFRHSLLE